MLNDSSLVEYLELAVSNNVTSLEDVGIILSELLKIWEQISLRSIYQLSQSLVNNAFTPNISVPLFIEYESVSKRKGVIELLSFDEIDSVLDYVLSKSQIRKVFYLW